MAVNPYIAAPVGLGAGVLALSNTGGVSESINALTAGVTGVVTGTQTLVNNIIGAKATAFAGSLAPFAAPVIGGYLGYKVAGKLGVENGFLKAGVGGVLGAGAMSALTITTKGSAALLSTWFSPAIASGALLAGGAYVGLKGAKWTWGKFRGKSA